MCFLSGTFLENTTLTSDTTWVLIGGVFVGANDREGTGKRIPVERVVLTIEAGTTILGDSATGAFLAVRRGHQIVAVGTATEPIVFTSSFPVGERARGQWGGLVINGNAPVNSCAEDPTKGGDPVSPASCEAFGEGGTGWYGGPDAADNSGTLSYVRVEFGGFEIGPDNELNGIAFQGVGSGTTIDHLQTHFGGDDGMEWFGGTVNAKYIVSTGSIDDTFDWTGGWSGKVQFAFGQQYSDGSDNGFEGDNNDRINVATPLTRPIWSNVTLVGSPASGASDIGALLREGTGGQFWSTILTRFNEACLSVAPDAASRITDGGLVLRNSIVYCPSPAVNFLASGQALFDAGTSNSTDDPGLGDPTDENAPNIVPANAIATTGGTTPPDPFFTEATYKGAVDPASDWVTQGIADGWISTAKN